MASQFLTIILALLSVASHANAWLNRTSNCSSATISAPPLFGGQVLEISAASVLNYSVTTIQVGDIAAASYTNLAFCNITVTYTHPGENDVINVQIWLPSPKAWNGNFQGQGGGSWDGGFPEVTHPQAIAQGFAAASTDAGHLEGKAAPEWGLLSPGNVNAYLLQDFSSVTLHDMAILAKGIIKSYYGTGPKFSYWSGCSTGGRQGLMLAQRYPTDYDGILALAPAINYDRLVIAEFWPQLVMQQLGVFPPPCEFEAIRQKAIEACDGLDGVVDGVIAAPGLCKFNPLALVNQTFACGEVQLPFSSEAATIINLTWRGPETADGKFLWYGLGPDAPLVGLVDTICTSSNVTDCTGVPFSVLTDWLRVFLAKDLNFDTSTITTSQYESFFHDSIDQYLSIIGTSNPDLSAFRAAGGKMITWHGLSDQLIVPGGSSEYYERVLELDPQARDFYRFFEAPGTYHCASGAGPFPGNVQAEMSKWVEQGEAPEVLNAIGADGQTKQLCLYPLVSRYISGDPTLAQSYVCAESF